MPDAESRERSPRKVPLRPYIIVGLILAAIPVGGYLAILWRDRHRRWAEDCFRRPAREFAGHKKEGFRSGIHSVAFSPDGRHALSGAYACEVCLWNVDRGEMTGTLSCDPGWSSYFSGAVYAVAFSSDGRRALCGIENSGVALLDLETKRTLRRFTGHRGPVNSVALSPDGTRALSGGADRTLRLWDLESGAEIMKLTGHANPTRSVAFAPDGRRAFSVGYDATARIWDLETGREIKRIVISSPSPICSVVFVPDGRRVVLGSEDGTVLFLDLESDREPERLTGHAGAITTVAVSADGRRAFSAGLDQTARLWDLEQRSLVRTFEMPQPSTMRQRFIQCAAFSPDGRHLLTGGWWEDLKRKGHTELLLWRLPDETGYWLLGTEEEAR